VFLTVRTLLCAALVVLISLGAHAFRYEPEGYGGIVWGTHISALKGMKIAGASPGSPDSKIYVMVKDSLRFGGVELKAVEYEFVKGKFRSVTLKVKDLAHYVALKKEAFRRFGPGREMHPFAERYFWEGSASKAYLVSAFDLS